jgi:uncharacterized membrane protein HdeD (DUF308 family)
MTTAPTFRIPVRGPDDIEEGRTEYWWIVLVTGVLWLVFSLLVFQFDETSVTAISVLVGVACLGAAVLELATVPASHGWWRAARIGLAAGFTVIGIVAFVNPGGSFDALAAVFAFYLLLRGVFEVVAALLIRWGGVEMWGAAWWLMLITGVLQILLAFWAAGNFGHKAFLLVVWVGAAAMAHGILQIVRAFELRPR